MGDLEFVGGAIGMFVGNQQCVHLAMGRMSELIHLIQVHGEERDILQCEDCYPGYLELARTLVLAMEYALTVNNRGWTWQNIQIENCGVGIQIKTGGTILNQVIIYRNWQLKRCSNAPRQLVPRFCWISLCQIRRFLCKQPPLNLHSQGPFISIMRS